MRKPFAVILMCALYASTLFMSACDKKPPRPPTPMVSAP